MGEKYDSFRLSANGFIRLCNHSKSTAKVEPCCPPLRGGRSRTSDGSNSSDAALEGPLIALYYTDLEPSLRVPGWPKASRSDGSGKAVSTEDGVVWAGGQPYSKSGESHGIMKDAYMIYFRR